LRSHRRLAAESEKSGSNFSALAHARPEVNKRNGIVSYVLTPKRPGQYKRNGIVLLCEERNAAIAPEIGRNSTMPWDPEGGDQAEQLLQEHPDDEQVTLTWPRQSAGDDRQAVAADAVRAREPAPQEHPADERPVVDSPPLHDDRHPDQDDEHADETRAGFLRRHPSAVALGLLVCAFATAGGYLYWDNAEHFESTDDSFIAARQFAIQPKVSGYITAVPVTDNQHVASSDVIARIDERDYRVALDQANAQLAHDQAVLEQAKTNLARFQYLVQRQAVAQQQLDDQNYLVEQDQATVSLDRAKVDAAQLNLSYTTVTAAQAGRVVSLSAAVGQFAQAGTTLTMFVPDEIWVTANFKETQLDAMRQGQPVTLTIDAYPERSIRGHVASVQSGSGPAFSLLPPENATGNWVKIVQRVPVKIVMDDPPADVALGPGMSVETTVRVNASPALYERLRSWL
jgi:membrane fusion protein (multidrug efflux system)